MLDHTPKACGSLGHGKRTPQKKADMTYQTEAPLNNKPRCGNLQARARLLLVLGSPSSLTPSSLAPRSLASSSLTPRTRRRPR